MRSSRGSATLVSGSKRREALLDGISIALFAGLVLTALATFTDYGMSWDETEHARYGDDIVKYFRADLAESAIPDHRQSYGGGYNLSAALFSNLVPHKRITSNHLFTALLGLPKTRQQIVDGDGMRLTHDTQ